jgi:hypothetical protein
MLSLLASSSVTLSSNEVIIVAAVIIVAIMSILHAVHGSLRRERWVMHQMSVSILVCVVAGLLLFSHFHN